MKRIIFVILLLFLFHNFIKGQIPKWIDATWREQNYPQEDFFIGFACIYKTPNLSWSQITEQSKTEAQADLAKKIRVQISTNVQNKISAQYNNGNYQETESFLNQSSIKSDAEVVGLKIETYHNIEEQAVYAFAYVNRQELIEYYKMQISILLKHIENLYHTAKQLETNGEKSKAREECQKAISIFTEVHTMQKLLSSIDIKNNTDLQTERMGILYKQIIQMSTQLTQGIYIYVNSQAKLFEQPYQLLESKIKAQLAEKGCSFVNDTTQADFLLYIEASTRISSIQNNIYYCYADITIKWVNTHKQLSVFNDGFSSKGGSVTKERAGRMALENASKEIVKRLTPWIQ